MTDIKKELTEDVFGNGYQNQPYQASYIKGEINITVRGEDKAEVMKDLKEMVGSYQEWVGAVGTVAAQQPTGGTMNQAVVKKCPRCNSDMVFLTGVSKKNGKPYKMNKCTNTACANIEWLK